MRRKITRCNEIWLWTNFLKRLDRGQGVLYALLNDQVTNGQNAPIPLPSRFGMTSPGAVLSTRERLIFAAIELFWEKGYANTSMSDLLTRANANSGSFYHFFPSKEDLLIAVLDRYLILLHPAMLGPA